MASDSLTPVDGNIEDVVRSQLAALVGAENVEAAKFRIVSTDQDINVVPLDFYTAMLCNGVVVEPDSVEYVAKTGTYSWVEDDFECEDLKVDTGGSVVFTPLAAAQHIDISPTLTK
jgi:hypothetical protein